MADYTRREVVVRACEWVLPSPTPLDEFEKACAAARSHYRQIHGIPLTAPMPPTNIRVRADDDQIVISFEVQERQP